MARTYQVKVLDENDYVRIVKANPRYKMAIDSLGFADPSRRMAFVRDTESEALNKYLVEHEFEHLLEEHATDEDANGIRHKKGFKDIGRNLAAISAAPFTGGLSFLGTNEKGREDIRQAIPKEVVDAGPIAGGLLGFGLGGPLGAGLGAAAGRAGKELLENNDPNQSLASRVMGNSAKSGLSGFAAGSGVQAAGNLGQGILTATKGLGGQASAAKGVGGRAVSGFSAPSVSSSSGAGGVSSLTNPISRGLTKPGMLANPLNASGYGAQNASAAGSPLTQFRAFPPTGGSPRFAAMDAAMSAINQTGQASQAAPGAAPATQAAGGSGLMSGLKMSGAGLAGFGNFLGSQPGQLLAGSALSAAPSLGVGPQTPDVPDLSELESIKQLRETAGQPQSELGKLAQGRLSEQLTGNFQGLNPTVSNSIRRSFDQERERLSSQFKLLRPNADLTSDSSFRQAMMDLNQREAETVGLAEQREQEQFNGLRRQDIGQALGIDEQTLQQLTQLAELDVQEIMVQLGLDAQKASEFKQQFGQLGGLFLQSGLGLGGFQPQQAQSGRP